ncbi:hypothetical protein [Streptomyces bluensis]|uniref:hypothetical protein n=1 Tax=Streptomyces bluensis TaxID=33897 RepID=UPI00331A4CBA
MNRASDEQRRLDQDRFDPAATSSNEVWVKPFSVNSCKADSSSAAPISASPRNSSTNAGC